MKMRLRWAKERINWTMEEWRGVVWSDESRYTVEGYDGGARVNRKKKERYETEHIKPVTKFSRGSVMLWGCLLGWWIWVFIDGSVNQDSYMNILSQSFLPWFVNLTEEHNRNFIFQEDGATCHTGGYATWWKNTHEIRRFDKWPAQSHDLKPIEHVWACLKNLIEDKRTSINNAEDLKVFLIEA